MSTHQIDTHVRNLSISNYAATHPPLPVAAASSRPSAFTWCTLKSIDEQPLMIGGITKKVVLLVGPPGAGKDTLSHNATSTLVLTYLLLLFMCACACMRG
jgi:predicted ATP-dependent serine protease